MARDICPRCNSMTALGDIKCFKCGYMQQLFSSGMFNNPITAALDLYLPDEIIFNPTRMSPMALQWLAKAYVFNDIILKQSIGYCPTLDKVFLPALDSDAVLHFYQLRSLDPKVSDKYKYLTYGRTSQYLIHYNDHSTINYNFPQTKPNHLLICEDHLSAIRLRKFGNVVALSGTTLSYKNALMLVQKYDSFTFWLDSDADKQPGKRPGRQALYKNIALLQKIADKYNTRRLFSGLDAHDYSFSHINYDTIIEDPKGIRDSRIANILTTEIINYDI